MTSQTVQRPARICSQDDCDRKHYGKGLCKAHWKRLDKGSEVAGPIGSRRSRIFTVRGNPTVRGTWPILKGTKSPRWLGDAVGYLGAHTRVHRARGAAKQQACAHCAAHANHWAYDHTDPNAKVGTDGPYSLDVNRYLPLCVGCHRRFDFAHAQGHR